MKKFTRDNIETHNILNIGSRQHGRLTTTTLLEYLEKLTELPDKGENFNILYLDFAGAQGASWRGRDLGARYCPR